MANATERARRSPRGAVHRGVWLAGLAVLLLIGLGLAGAVVVSVVPGLRESRQRPRVCWDPPSTGQPARYELTFDGAPDNAAVTTERCLSLPALPPGEHVVDVRAVDAHGQASPPTTIRFTVR